MGSHFADNITVEKKADATYKVVGAGEHIYHSLTIVLTFEFMTVSASIIAKQTRDILLDRHQYGKSLAKLVKKAFMC